MWFASAPYPVCWSSAWLGHPIFSRISCYYKGILGLLRKTLQKTIIAFLSNFTSSFSSKLTLSQRTAAVSKNKHQAAFSPEARPALPCLTSMGLVGQHEQKEWKSFHKKLVICLKRSNSSGFDELVFEGQVVSWRGTYNWTQTEQSENPFPLIPLSLVLKHIKTIKFLGFQHTFRFFLNFCPPLALEVG